MFELRKTFKLQYRKRDERGQMVQTELLLFMVVKHVRVNEENRRKLLNLLERERQQRVEFITAMVVLSSVVLAAIIGLYAVA